MGTKARIALTLAGLAAWEIAASQLRFPDAIDLIKDTINGFAQHPGEGLIVPFKYLGIYGRDFMYDNFAKLGLIGQLGTYGGLLKLAFGGKPEKIEEGE